MKNSINTIIMFLLIINLGKAQSVNKDAILGEWLSEEKDGKVLIFKQGEKYFGKVIWGKSAGKKDEKNPDPSLRNRDIIGSTILKDFSFKGKSWEDGNVYDPNNGKSYSCTMKLKSNDELEIRGYVGISLLGRSTVWTRVK